MIFKRSDKKYVNKRVYSIIFGSAEGATSEQWAKRAAKLWIVIPCHRRRASRCAKGAPPNARIIIVLLLQHWSQWRHEDASTVFPCFFTSEWAHLSFHTPWDEPSRIYLAFAFQISDGFYRKKSSKISILFRYFRYLSYMDNIDINIDIIAPLRLHVCTDLNRILNIP